MSLPKHTLQLPAVDLTSRGLGDSRSSCSSLSDNVCSADTPTALLEDYNRVFTQLSSLRDAIEQLAYRAVRVLHAAGESAKDSVHTRLFCKLGDRLTELCGLVRKSGLCEGTPVLIRRNASLSLSLYKTKNQEATSVPVPKLDEIQDKPTLTVNNKGDFSTPPKRTKKLLTRSVTNTTPQVSTGTSSVMPRRQMTDEVLASLELRTEECTVESQSDKRLNYFDLIAHLMRLNFVDHDQVLVLKRAVIKRDQRLLKPLREYELDRDLQVLIGKIGGILESYDSLPK